MAEKTPGKLDVESAGQGTKACLWPLQSQQITRSVGSKTLVKASADKRRLESYNQRQPSSSDAEKIFDRKKKNNIQEENRMLANILHNRAEETGHWHSWCPNHPVVSSITLYYKQLVSLNGKESQLRVLLAFPQVKNTHTHT